MISRLSQVCYPVGVDIDQRPTHGFDGRRPRTSAGDQSLLVARASRGDVEAFSRLVKEHSALVYRVARRMLGREDAQDASQEVWVRVWQNIRGFRAESAFTTWLYKITMNTCLSIRQRHSRRKEREVCSETSYLSEPAEVEADPEAAALSTERRKEIHSALRRVRVEHRAALVLRHMEGLSYAEIAKVLEIPEGTAKGWVSRGRAAMLVALAQDPAPDSIGHWNFLPDGTPRESAGAHRARRIYATGE